MSSLKLDAYTNYRKINDFYSKYTKYRCEEIGSAFFWSTSRTHRKRNLSTFSAWVDSNTYKFTRGESSNLGEKTNESLSKKGVSNKFWKLALTERYTFGSAVAAVGVYGFSSTLIPAVLGGIVDKTASTSYSKEIGTSENAVYALTKLFGLFALAGISNFFRHALTGVGGERIIARLRKYVYEAIMNQDAGFFDENANKTLDLGSTKSSKAPVRGSLVQLLNDDCNQVGESLSSIVINGSKNIFFTVGAITIMCKFSGKLTAVILLLAVPPVAAFSMIYGYFVRCLTHKMKDKMGIMSEVAQERIINIMETVKAFGKEHFETSYYERNVDEVYNITTKMLLLNASYVGILHTIGYVALYGILVIASTLLTGPLNVDKHRSFFQKCVDFFANSPAPNGLPDTKDASLNDGGGRVMSYLIYTVYFGIGLMGLAHLLSDYNKGMAAYLRIATVVDRCEGSNMKTEKKAITDVVNNGDTSVVSETVLTPVKIGQFDIKLKNVTFFYPSRPDVLIYEKLSLHIKANKWTCIVGSSGVGKSTLAYLLLKLYRNEQTVNILLNYPQNGHPPISNGEILIDGHNINNVNTAYLKSRTGYVGQEPRLFTGTIAQNIAYGLKNDDENWSSWDDPLTPSMYTKIKHAAKKAHADEFICALPFQYDTVINGSTSTSNFLSITAKRNNTDNTSKYNNSDGNNVFSSVSGGQKQRIAIARAFIRNPQLLILDEATSALDHESELLVVRAMDDFIANARDGDRKVTVLMFAHKVSMIQKADHIIMLGNRGDVVAEGDYAHLCNVPVFKKLVGLVSN